MQGFQLVWQGFFNKWNLVGVHLSISCLCHSALTQPNTNSPCRIAQLWSRFTCPEILGKIHRSVSWGCFSTQGWEATESLDFILFSSLNLWAYCVCNWQQTWSTKAAHPLLWLILLWSVILFDIQCRADTGYCNATLPNRLQNCAGSIQHSCR